MPTTAFSNLPESAGPDRHRLLLEHDSFFVLVAPATGAAFFFLLRVLLAWYADRQLRIQRFHFLEHVARAGAALFSTPEIK